MYIHNEKGFILQEFTDLEAVFYTKVISFIKYFLKSTNILSSRNERDITGSPEVNQIFFAWLSEQFDGQRSNSFLLWELVYAFQ